MKKTALVVKRRLSEGRIADPTLSVRCWNGIKKAPFEKVRILAGFGFGCKFDHI